MKTLITTYVTSILTLYFYTKNIDIVWIIIVVPPFVTLCFSKVMNQIFSFYFYSVLLIFIPICWLNGTFHWYEIVFMIIIVLSFYNDLFENKFNNIFVMNNDKSKVCVNCSELTETPHIINENFECVINYEVLSEEMKWKMTLDSNRLSESEWMKKYKVGDHGDYLNRFNNLLNN